MATYSGMSLRGEVRESISLDEDDLSDVEDEVFIRDGKNGFKLAEELNVKRPLMAPRRRAARSDVNTVLKNRPSCKVFCKPCCYVYAALSIFIGLITLVVVLVSMYPLPLDKLREWTLRKSTKEESILKLMPCNNLKMTDVWSINLPKITTDSSVRTLDVNEDGVEDILFGFGTGENYSILSPDDFCPIFMGVSSPCEGGIVALNGLNGDIIWRHWLNDTIFSLQCSLDINGDQLNDCLAVGVAGTMLVIHSKNGSTIWQLNTGKKHFYVANFIPDQNNDTVPDILASHSSLSGARDGHIVLFSGKNGDELQTLKMPNGSNTFYMSQFLSNSNNKNVLIHFGTGTSPFSENSNKTKTVYEDTFKGMLNSSIFVDITGDDIPDIVTTMYNSTLVAINGKTFEQIWNFTVPGATSATTIMPTPAYFTFDNITDFLIIYQTADDILNYTYTKTFIIDGQTGESIYNPISGSIFTQMGGLSLSMESYGYDMFLFWTSECIRNDIFEENTVSGDDCRNQFNNTKIFKLNALSQFHQPPGFTVYDSVDRKWKEFNNIQSPLKQLSEYYKKHPNMFLDEPGQTEMDENYKVVTRPIILRKYGSSNIKHRDKNNEKDDGENVVQDAQDIQDYQWAQNPSEGVFNDLDPLFNDYNTPVDEELPIAQEQIMLSNNKMQHSNHRDPRNKENQYNAPQTMTTTKKKSLAEGPVGIYNLNNVQLAQNRLLHDLDYIPIEILKDTFVKNEERRLRRSKFEQRDVNMHYDKLKEKEEIRKTIEAEINAAKNNNFNLWDLESEKEIKDRAEINFRGKRNINYMYDSSTKITTIGAVMDSLNKTNETNSVDIVFITYWQPPAIQEEQMLKKDIKKCVANKMFENTKDGNGEKSKSIETEQRDQFRRECLEEQENLKNSFNDFHKLYQLRFGQLTVRRLRIECECLFLKRNGRCAKFLPKKDQSWPCYLGRFGNGMFSSRP